VVEIEHKLQTGFYQITSSIGLRYDIFTCTQKLTEWPA